MIAAKRAWSLYKKKKAAFITWPLALWTRDSPPPVPLPRLLQKPEPQNHNSFFT
ncbi:hypothetical protein CCACVL1_16681 [Corchorus capsularis]|uniref:Uncharacterized protein n=1 Tax=Corchorus capsularis TaxID=210143 RepID=A0A1R3HW35_COCAP|nr:hypothetical protein CCACVL1_16681 [Corchorus capsularis]